MYRALTWVRPNIRMLEVMCIMKSWIFMLFHAFFLPLGPLWSGKTFFTSRTKSTEFLAMSFNKYIGVELRVNSQHTSLYFSHNCDIFGMGSSQTRPVSLLYEARASSTIPLITYGIACQTFSECEWFSWAESQWHSSLWTHENFDVHMQFLSPEQGLCIQKPIASMVLLSAVREQPLPWVLLEFCIVCFRNSNLLHLSWSWLSWSCRTTFHERDESFSSLSHRSNQLPLPYPGLLAWSQKQYCSAICLSTPDSQCACNTAWSAIFTWETGRYCYTPYGYYIVAIIVHHGISIRNSPARTCRNQLCWTRSFCSVWTPKLSQQPLFGFESTLCRSHHPRIAVGRKVFPYLSQIGKDDELRATTAIVVQAAETTCQELRTSPWGSVVNTGSSSHPGHLCWVTACSLSRLISFMLLQLLML